MTFKFDAWTWKIIGHLFYATSSFVHHIIPIGQFKVELQSGNAKMRVKIGNFPMWPWNLTVTLNKANLRDLIAATDQVIFLKFYSNRRFFSPCNLKIWWMTSTNNRAPLLYYIKLCASVVSNWSYRPDLGQNWQFFVPCDLGIWLMTLENNRAPILCCLKLCASFQSHRWIQTGVTVQKCSIWLKIGEFLSRVTLKFARRPSKTTGHLFCATLSFLHHLRAIVEFNWSYSPETLNSGQNRQFLSRVTLKFDNWIWKTTGHLFYVAPSFVHHFIAIREFKLELQFGNAQFESKSTIFLAMWPRNLTDDLDKRFGACSMLLQALCIIS